jgi:hypothetical protein
LKKKVVDIAGSWPDDSGALADLFARAGQEPLQAEFNSEPNKQGREKFRSFPTAPSSLKSTSIPLDKHK